MYLDGHLYTLLNEDLILSRTTVSDDLSHIVENLLAATEDNLDALAIFITTEVLDNESLIYLCLSQTAICRTCIPYIQPKFATIPAFRIALVTCQEDRLGQLNIAQSYVEAGADLDEKDLYREPGFRYHWDTSSPFSAQAKPDADFGESNSECAGADPCVHFHAKTILFGFWILIQEYMEIKSPEEAETTATQRHATAYGDVEMALGTQPAVSVQGHQAKEVH